MLSPYVHELDGSGMACADDCGACHWATDVTLHDIENGIWLEWLQKYIKTGEENEIH